MALIPQTENLFSDTASKSVYKYYDKNKKDIFKTKEIFKSQKKIIFYLYFLDKRTDVITRPKIKEIEFNGWDKLENLPSEFVSLRSGSYSIKKSFAYKSILSYLNPKFPKLEKIVISANGINRFSVKTINFKWEDLDSIVKSIKKEKNSFEKNKRGAIDQKFAMLSTKFPKYSREIYYGELKTFLDKFTSFNKVNDSDVTSLSSLFNVLPKSKISVTSNFIQTKDKINIAYLEDIISEFEKNSAVSSDNEKQWQNFFEKNSWVFAHLFAYEVILKQKEAYVGGKTISNKDGKVVDFLYESGFQDNFALIEIKTHNKDLLKKSPYRGSDVFSMSDDLSGGINQCLDQKDNFLRDFGQDLKPIDPKCILVIGQKQSLTKHQLKCFELLRNNQKNVDIVTFDELLHKIKGLLKVIKIK